MALDEIQEAQEGVAAFLLVVELVEEACIHPSCLGVEEQE